MVAESAPTDGWRVFLTYAALGSGTLASWNAFITAADYFEAQYPGQHSDRLFTVTYLPTNLAAVAALTHWHAAISTRARVVAGFSGAAACLAGVPLLALFYPGAPLAITLCLLATVAVCDALAQPAIFAEAAGGRAHLTRALVVGTAVAGVMACTLRVLTKGMLPATPAGLVASAVSFFLVAAAWVGVCLVLYLGGTAQHAGQGAGVAPGSEGMRHGTPPAAAAGVEMASPVLSGLHLTGEDDDAEAVLLGHAGPARSSSMQRREAHAPTLLWPTLRATWQLALATCLIYVITLSIFPGVLVEDAQSSSMGGGWYTVALVFLFNIGDLGGKGGPILIPALRWSRQKGILAAVCLRVLFIPAFYFTVSIPPLLMLCTLALGLTNGLLTSCAMASAPAHVPSGPQASLAGSIMVASLTLGLTLGAACGFLWLL